MSAVRNQKTAPGPRGHVLLGNLPEFRQDVLGQMLQGLRLYGDIVRFRLGPHVVHLINHPDHVKHVLQNSHQRYDKVTRSISKIKWISGQSLLTSNGDSWLHKRRLMQPAFHHQRIAMFAGVMTDAAASMLRCWEGHAERGRPIDVASEMMRLTYNVVGKTLFSSDDSGEASEVERSITVALEHIYRSVEAICPLPPSFPTPRNRRFQRALRTLDRIVYGIINSRRREKTDRGDLLSMLLLARDEATGEGMSDQQLRHETITLLLAGHETTGNALTWVWYLLSQYPSVESKLRAELAQTLQGKVPSLQDLSNLQYTRMVIQEAMRLYPPIWAIERRAISDDEIGGYHIPADSMVVISPYVIHRHPDFWINPEQFDPERFSPERTADRPRYAYVPFGAGPRLCIGNNFAMLEAQLVTAMVAQAYRLRLVPGHPVKPQPGITLRTRHGLLMTLQR